MSTPLTIQGVGICLRSSHYDVFLADDKPVVPWLEILADNYLGCSGVAWDKLCDIASHYPVVLHCVGLGVGNTGKIDLDYQQKIKQMIDKLQPMWVSDHLCWTAFAADHSHALLPLPFNKEAADHVIDRIISLQSLFKTPVVIENIAAYLRSPEDTMSEASFMNYIARQSDCGILVDINNLFVNAYNHQESAIDFLNEIDSSRVKQYHLAGYEQDKGLLIDTHSCTVSDPVWSLYKQALQIVGARATCVEWDADIPSWAVLLDETKKTADLLLSEKKQGMLCV